MLEQFLSVVLELKGEVAHIGATRASIIEPLVVMIAGMEWKEPVEEKKGEGKTTARTYFCCLERFTSDIIDGKQQQYEHTTGVAFKHYTTPHFLGWLGCYFESLLLFFSFRQTSLTNIRGFGDEGNTTLHNTNTPLRNTFFSPTRL